MKTAFSILLFFAITVAASAQYQFLLAFGNFSELKKQASVNVEFSYDGLTVGNYNQTDSQYVALIKAEHNAKQPGSGDEWEKMWYSYRTSVYEPEFHKMLRRESKIKNTTDSTAKYTILVHVTMMKMGPDALINADILLLESQDKKKCSTRVISKNVPGYFVGFNFTTPDRIAASFAKAGKELGILISAGRR